MIIHFFVKSSLAKILFLNNFHSNSKATFFVHFFWISYAYYTNNLTLLMYMLRNSHIDNWSMCSLETSIGVNINQVLICINHSAMIFLLI